jgi:hypothetical protein
MEKLKADAAAEHGGRDPDAAETTVRVSLLVPLSGLAAAAIRNR